MKNNPRVAEGLLDSEFGQKPTYVPLKDLTDEEIGELPRQAFSQEEFDSLSDWLQEEIHEGKQSQDNIDGIYSSLVNRIDWADDPDYHDVNTDSWKPLRSLTS
jgi:hypothetical protein